VIVHQEAQEGLLGIANGKTKNFHSGARHLTTTVTFPFESFTESVSNDLLSSIPYLIGKKGRMASVLVISNFTDQEKALWSIWSVNFARQVEEVPRRLEFRRFNAKPELLHPQAFF
jgi:hypothetical protein